MKKKLIFAGAVVLMAAAAVTAYMANYRPDPFDLLNANIEALAQDETLEPGESGKPVVDCCVDKFICTGDYCGTFIPAYGGYLTFYYNVLFFYI